MLVSILRRDVNATPCRIQIELYGQLNRLVQGSCMITADFLFQTHGKIKQPSRVRIKKTGRAHSFIDSLGRLSTHNFTTDFLV